MKKGLYRIRQRDINFLTFTPTHLSVQRAYSLIKLTHTKKSRGCFYKIYLIRTKWRKIQNERRYKRQRNRIKAAIPPSLFWIYLTVYYPCHFRAPHEMKLKLVEYSEWRTQQLQFPMEVHACTCKSVHSPTQEPSRRWGRSKGCEQDCCWAGLTLVLTLTVIQGFIQSLIPWNTLL